MRSAGRMQPGVQNVQSAGQLGSVVSAHAQTFRAHTFFDERGIHTQGQL